MSHVLLKWALYVGILAVLTVGESVFVVAVVRNQSRSIYARRQVVAGAGSRRARWWLGLPRWTRYILIVAMVGVVITLVRLLGAIFAPYLIDEPIGLAYGLGLLSQWIVLSVMAISVDIERERRLKHE